MAHCLAGALSATGIGTGNTVAGMAPNLPEVLKAHYDVHMIGAMPNLRNIRLNARWFWRSNKALVVLFLRMEEIISMQASLQSAQPTKELVPVNMTLADMSVTVERGSGM